MGKINQRRNHSFPKKYYPCNLQYNYERYCQAIFSNSCLVVASSIFLSSRKRTRRGKRRAKPKAWIGLRVTSSAIISTTIRGLTQTSGNKFLSTKYSSGLSLVSYFTHRAFNSRHCSSDKPRPILAIEPISPLESGSPTKKAPIPK